MTTHCVKAQESTVLFITDDVTHINKCRHCFSSQINPVKVSLTLRTCHTTSKNVVLLTSKHWRIIHWDTQESIRQCYEWKKVKSEELGT
jgi:hypothetical protein